MAKHKKNKNTFFFCVHSSVCLKKKKISQKRNKSKTKDMGSLCPCGVDPSLMIYNSQFDIVQNSDTDYRHVICLGLAPVR